MLLSSHSSASDLCPTVVLFSVLWFLVRFAPLPVLSCKPYLQCHKRRVLLLPMFSLQHLPMCTALHVNTAVSEGM